MAGFTDLLRQRGRVYLLEAVVCFGSLVVLLGLGLIALPLAFSAEGDNVFGWQLVAMLGGGFVGLWGVTQLVLKVAYPARQVASPRAIVSTLLLGIGALLLFYQWLLLSRAATLTLVVLPLLGTAHFLFLGRDYLVRQR
ncbi:MAG: hypothetical protein V7756_15775 [Halopseudomonas sp.]|uniref:hypothetical protein n=1 Tax=Halopseudomonas sp. TaxID=2901191 RepID=UPI00300347C5